MEVATFISFWLVLLAAVFFLQLMGLMKVVPIYISSPILFITLFIIVYNINERHRFKGF